MPTFLTTVLTGVAAALVEALVVHVAKATFARLVRA